MMPSPARGNRRTCSRRCRTFRRRTGYNDDTMLLLGYSPNRRIRSYVPRPAYFPLPGRESSRFIPISFSSNISRRDSSLRRQGKGTAVGSRTTDITGTPFPFPVTYSDRKVIEKCHWHRTARQVPCYQGSYTRPLPDRVLTGTVSDPAKKRDAEASRCQI